MQPEYRKLRPVKIVVKEDIHPPLELLLLLTATLVHPVNIPMLQVSMLQNIARIVSVITLTTMKQKKNANRATAWVAATTKINKARLDVSNANPVNTLPAFQEHWCVRIAALAHLVPLPELPVKIAEQERIPTWEIQNALAVHLVCGVTWK